MRCSKHAHLPSSTLIPALARLELVVQPSILRAHQGQCIDAILYPIIPPVNILNTYTLYHEIEFPQTMVTFLTRFICLATPVTFSV